MSDECVASNHALHTTHRRLANVSDPRLERGSDGVGEQPDHPKSLGQEIQGFCPARSVIGNDGIVQNERTRFDRAFTPRSTI